MCKTIYEHNNLRMKRSEKSEGSEEEDGWEVLAIQFWSLNIAKAIPSIISKTF